MERWKLPPGPTCNACLKTADDSFPSGGCNMITPGGHSTPLKNPQNLTSGHNNHLLLAKNSSHLIKSQLNKTNGQAKQNHLDIVKDSLCCFKPNECDSSPPPAKKNFPVEDEFPDGFDLDKKIRDDRCGFCSYRPQWMQKLANKKVFLAVFCLTSVLQGMYYTYFVSVLTTIEKLYQIQSKTTGLIMSATELGQIGGALLLTYYGGQGHRPKWIACGMLVFAFASIFCSMPHFLYSELTNPILSSSKENLSMVALRDLKSKLCHIRPNHSSFALPLSSSALDGVMDETAFDQHSFMFNRSHRSAHADLGQTNSDQTSTSFLSLPEREALHSPYHKCNDDHEGGGVSSFDPTHIVMVIFFFSLLAIGIGATAVYTLGIPYIDDNVATRESPMYFGITIGVRIFGPVFGFLLGSFCTSIYVNFPFETTEITTDNPQWLGAWWLGVLIVGGCLIVTALPMIGFPKHLPKPCQHRPPLNLNGNQLGPNADCQLCRHAEYCKRKKKKKPSIREFPGAVRRLLRNEVLVFRTASSVLHILPIAGLYTFLPKYLESQFQLTASMANMVSGIAGILVMGFGIFASGTFMRQYKPSAQFVARWIAASAALYAVGMLILMLFGCPLNSYVGLNSGSEYEDLSQKTCNETCGCKAGEFAPICTSEGVTYLSPCLAGCTHVYGKSYEEFTYRDCLCLGANVTAVNGFCPLQCNNLLPYIFVFAIFVLVHSTSEVGSMLLTLRCVDPDDKAMALGLIAFAIGLFGNVPCPIIYGAVVDSACLFWEVTCGERGACRLYDPSKFRGVFHGVTAVIMTIGFFVDIVVCRKAKNIQFNDEDILPMDVEEAYPFSAHVKFTNQVIQYPEDEDKKLEVDEAVQFDDVKSVTASESSV